MTMIINCNGMMELEQSLKEFQLYLKEKPKNINTHMIRKWDEWQGCYLTEECNKRIYSRSGEALKTSPSHANYKLVR